MIEMRARRKLVRARDTLAAYESTLTDHSIEIEKGVRIFDIPHIVLREGDKFGIHLQTNFIEIIRIVKGHRPSLLRKGRTANAIMFSFNEKGKVRLIES